eukprot:11922379-Prorocentrum_lima.AAC.1
MTSSLVGSEMCIRDRQPPRDMVPIPKEEVPEQIVPAEPPPKPEEDVSTCLLYTSDAADDM